MTQRDVNPNIDLQNDKFREHLGVEIVELRSGYAKVKGMVKEEYLNFHGTAHGSYIMALADFAFALAANSDGTRRMAVMIKLNFYKPANAGDEITGEAEVVRGRRLVFCRVCVKRGEETIAEGDAIAAAV